METRLQPLPKNVTRSVVGDRLVLTRSWKTGAAWIIAGFTVVWDAFLFVWYYLGFTRPDISWVMLAFPLLHVAFGLVLTYVSFGLFLNKTVIEFSADLLRITIGPIPFGREVQLAPAEIREVYFHENVSRGYSSTYDVRALTVSGKEKNLLRGLGEYSEVLFYLAEFRSMLGLPEKAPESREIE